MTDCKCPCPDSEILSGREFRVLLPKETPLKSVYRVCLDIWKNGGILLEKKKDGCIFIKEKGKTEQEWMKESGSSLWTLGQLYEKLSLPLPSMLP